MKKHNQGTKWWISYLLAYIDFTIQNVENIVTHKNIIPNGLLGNFIGLPISKNDHPNPNHINEVHHTPCAVQIISFGIINIEKLEPISTPVIIQIIRKRGRVLPRPQTVFNDQINTS